MQTDDEFHRPLKGRGQKSDLALKHKTLIALGVALVFILPLAHFYGVGSAILGLFKSGEKEVTVVRSQSEPEIKVVLRDSIELNEDNTSQAQDNSGPATLTEIVPSGEINPPKQLQPQIFPRADVKRQEQSLAHLPDPELTERGATGVIPKKSSNGLRPLDVYSRRPDTEGNFGVARVVIVIGGIGISQSTTKSAIDNLPGSITLAFAPYGNSLGRWMQYARKGGHELLLQVPMEPIDYPQNNPGQHTILADADLQENLASLHWSMSRITNYVGVMNYLGNKFLSQPASMTPIFTEFADRGLMFFDDGTARNSSSEGVALKALLPYARADIVLDDVRSRQAINAKLVELVEQAKRTGLAVGTGNAFPDTIALVAEFARQAKELGVEITPVSAIATNPGR